MNRIAALFAAALCIAAPAAESAPAPLVRGVPPGAGLDAFASTEASSGGIGIFVPVVGRLTGGGILYVTSLDVSNFSAAAAPADFLFQGEDVLTGAPISFTGSFSVATGGAPLGAFSSVHYDDFLHAMAQSGLISGAEESDGVLGSLLIVFDGITDASQASARARFYSQQFGGTIGVSLNGHVFDGTETTAVVGVFTDTSTLSDPPRLYSNIFLTNVGKYDAGTGQFLASDDNVTLTAYSASTGAVVGQPKPIALGSGRTVSLKLTSLGVPPSVGQVIVVAKATSGQGLLLGVGSENDEDTKDPSTFGMNAASPSAGPPVSGDLAAALAGTWNGTWNNTTFSTLGPAKLVISVDSSAKTYAATLTLGGGVFGGSAPPPQSFPGSYSTSSGATFSGHSSLFGDFTFTITPAGAISGSATNVPSSNVGSMTFTGTATATTITIHYTLNLKPSGTATGTVTLTKSGA